MKEMRRVLALVLCFVMLVGVVPVGALAAEAETTAPSVAEETLVTEAAAAETAEIEFDLGSVSMAAADVDDGTDYLFIATDRHADTSVIGNIINNMESAIGENELDYLALGGDMVGSGNSHPAYNSSTVLAEVTGATSSLSAKNVDIVAGIHDMNVTDDAGIVLPYQGGGAKIYEGTNYYVYGVEEYCISENSNSTNWAAEAQTFVDWANGSDIDKSKAIIVVSHYPLHAKRSDNPGAVYWHNALNTVATGSESGTEIVRDIVFFHGHNHTVDSTEYCKTAGKDTLDIEGGSSGSAIYYTYATAGYLNQNKKATLVTITGDTISLTKYTTSGSGTAMTSVERTVEVSLNYINVTGTKAYTVGDALDLTVTAYYSDGTYADVTDKAEMTGYDLGVSGEQVVNVTYGGQTVNYGITVGVSVTTQNGDIISSGTAGLTGITAVWNDTDLSETLDDQAYSAYDIVLNGYTEGEVTVTLDVAYVNAATAELYYVNSDGSLTEITEFTAEATEYGSVVTFTAASGSFTVAVGNPASGAGIPAGAELTGLTIEGPTKKYYFLNTDTRSDGNVYLDITGLVVNAVYTYEGVEYPKTLDWNEFDETIDGYALSFGDLTTKGEKTVTVSYGGQTAQFTVWVCEQSVADETIGASIVFDTEIVTAVTVEKAAEVSDTIAAALAEKLSGTLTVYNINATYAAEETALQGTASVTLTIPEGVTNPAVYYVSDEGETEAMPTTNNGDGTLTFITTHFSSFVVGENTEITVPDNQTQTGTSGDKKTVYVLVDSPSAGNDYVIVNRNSAGSGSAMDGDLAAATVTVNAATTSITDPYIESPANAIIWSATSGLNFQNAENDAYLRYNSGLTTTTSSSNATDWSYSSNYLRCYSSRYYYVYLDGSSWEASRYSSYAENVYFYEKTEIDTTTSGTYTIEGKDLTQVVDKNTAATLTGTLSSTLTFTPTSGEATTTDTSATATYEIVTVDANGNTVDGDPNDIISGINGNTVTFTGNYGKALVKVSYTTSFGDVTDYITVNASEPYYTIQLHEYIEYDEDGNVLDDPYVGDEITAPVALKGIEEGDEYAVWGVIKYYNGIIDGKETEETGDGTDIGTLEDYTRIYWDVSNTNIAEIDPETGILTFTGREYGTFEVTAHYLDEDGVSLCEDTITISVTKSQYVVEGDGTDDFPEYPNQGAIRIDKTAEAVGNFSQTGIAKVELSMTGVPYGTNAKTDVVVMVDMTASMSDDDVDAAELAVQELIKSLVYDEENDKYDSNIQLFVDVFYSASSDSAFETEEYLNNVTISNATELAAAQAKITFSQSSQGGGTRYNMAMADVYETLNREGHADNQFVVFVSDGVATAYSPLVNGAQGTTITGSNSTTNSLAAGWFDDSGEVTTSFKTEYYSYLIKSAGIPIYTVGANLTALSDAADVLNHMSSNYSPDGKTSTGETKYSFFCTTSGGITDEVLNIFKGIGQSIKEAATNVVVEDMVGNDYTLTFSLPSGVTADEAGMEDFYIQVVGYTLDENNERMDNPAVLEKFLFAADGTITHTIGATTCENCSHVTKTSGVVTKIDGTYFDYVSNDDGEFLTWTADKLDRTELALQYFAYLDNSAGDVAADKQKEPDTYYTNEYATVTYTNFNGVECQKVFPKPSMTWKGAKVTYVFYLVNEAGQPVNRAGKVVPFAEAVYVTDPYTYDVTWNEAKGIEKLDAAYLAKDYVPSVYELYDTNAYYEILVYQTEGVDEDTQAVNYNHFIIEGTSGITNENTTKVFNTKAGVRYDDYGAYSATAGTYTSTKSGTAYTIAKGDETTNIDYANTTVAFAVVWKPALVEDTVVVDYGLDVSVDVITNDALAAGVTGVMLEDIDNVAMNSGTYTAAKGSTEVTSNDGAWTASVDSLSNVRFRQNNMLLKEPVTFYYEAGVNYYTYDADDKATLNTTNMYSSVTVIPATTVYYEDYFLDLTTYTKGTDGTWAEGDNKWTLTNRSSISQQVDRPGVDKVDIEDSYDADNPYGYDQAYSSMSTHSLGGSAKITVDANTRGEATFTFYGTGFDIISMASNATGTMTLQVYEGAAATGTPVKSTIIDTFFSYEQNVYEVTYFYVASEEEGVDGTWVETSAVVVETEGTPGTIPEEPKTGDTYTTYETRWNVTNDDNSIYQVPILKIYGLEYGQYTAKLIAGYNEFFDHVEGSDSYDLYLDAVRIYDPTGDLNSTANDAYAKDNEASPEYTEIRDNIIKENGVSVQKTVDEDGKPKYTVVFNKDGNISGGVIFTDTVVQMTSISDYTNYGPNNEVYLTKGQSIAFKIPLKQKANVADVQLGMKSATKANATLTMDIVQNGETVYNGTGSVVNSTTTDMYYSIKNNIEDLTEDAIIVLTNSGTADSIVSITNLKLTFTAASGEKTQSLGDITGEEAGAILTMLNARNANTAPEVLPDADLDVSIRSKNIKAGSNIAVKATTSADVDYLMVNGQKITKYSENKSTGKRSWSINVKAAEAGDMDIEVTAYSADGDALETITETVKVTAKSGTVQQIVGQLIGMLGR